MDNPEKDYIEYINQLTEIENIALKIAREQLQTSFDVKKSIGYIKWKQQKDDNK